MFFLLPFFIPEILMSDHYTHTEQLRIKGSPIDEPQQTGMGGGGGGGRDLNRAANFRQTGSEQFYKLNKKSPSNGLYKVMRWARKRKKLKLKRFASRELLKCTRQACLKMNEDVWKGRMLSQTERP